MKNFQRFQVLLSNQLPLEQLPFSVCASTLFLFVNSLMAFKLHHKPPEPEHPFVGSPRTVWSKTQVENNIPDVETLNIQTQARRADS